MRQRPKSPEKQPHPQRPHKRRQHQRHQQQSAEKTSSAKFKPHRQNRQRNRNNQRHHRCRRRHQQRIEQSAQQHVILENQMNISQREPARFISKSHRHDLHDRPEQKNRKKPIQHQRQRQMQRLGPRPRSIGIRSANQSHHLIFFLGALFGRSPSALSSNCL